MARKTLMVNACLCLIASVVTGINAQPIEAIQGLQDDYPDFYSDLSSGVVFGWQFQVKDYIYVTALGLYDRSGNGFEPAIYNGVFYGYPKVCLYDNSKNPPELICREYNESNQGSPISYQDVSGVGVILEPGKTYQILGDAPIGNPNLFPLYFSLASTGPEIETEEPQIMAYDDGSIQELNFSRSNEDNSYVFAVNFKYTVTSPVVPVDIDIKPGNDDNIIGLGTQGVIPVAILSTSDFDAVLEVNPETVTLEGNGVKVKGNGSVFAQEKDVNGDGYDDLVLQIDVENLDPETVQDGEATLTGCLNDGTCGEDATQIEGTDIVTIVPE